MLQNLITYLVTHRSAILGTIVALQNAHIIKGVSSPVISALVSLLGG